MTERWEYTAVSWAYTFDTEGPVPTWRQTFSIHRAGQATEERPYWSSETPDDTGPSLLEILNELGAEGWELVNDTVNDSKIMDERGGWAEVGTPIARQYLFKRRL